MADLDRSLSKEARRAPECDPLPSPDEFLKRHPLGSTVEILSPHLDPEKFDAALREMGMTREEWDRVATENARQARVRQVPREPIPENRDPLSLVAKEKLSQVATPDPEFLYVLQLMRWARMQGEVPLPPTYNVRETADSFLEQLLGTKPATAWKWLLSSGLDEEENAHMGLDPKYLESLTPSEVAAELLEAYFDRLISETSETLDLTPEK